jgi:mRNA-degrading endonuclease toxin of MazEF toxin-antitoxin module
MVSVEQLQRCQTNVSQIITIDKLTLDEQVGHVSARTLEAVEQGLRLVLDL